MLLAAAYGAYAASATSPVFGVYKIDCPADSDTYIGIPATRTPEFSGVVEGIQTANFKIVAKGEPQWTTNKFVYSAGSQPNHYYLKFTSGALEGAWYDINSNDAYSLSIDIGPAEFAKISEGDSFQIIPHWTMCTLFPDGGGFIKSLTGRPSGASLLYRYTKFTEDGVVCPVGINRALAYSYLYVQRDPINGWRNGSDLSEDSSNEVIEPNSVIKVSQPAETSTVTFTGIIPECATSFELFTMPGEEGESQPQDIYVATPSAVDIKMSDLTECLVNSGAFATGVRAGTDFIYIYRNERIGKNLTQDDSCWYIKRGDVERWVDEDQGDGGGCILKAGGIIVIRKAATSEPVAMRCTFYPSYLESLKSN